MGKSTIPIGPFSIAILVYQVGFFWLLLTETVRLSENTFFTYYCNLEGSENRGTHGYPKSSKSLYIYTHRYTIWVLKPMVTWGTFILGTRDIVSSVITLSFTTMALFLCQGLSRSPCRCHPARGHVHIRHFEFAKLFFRKMRCPKLDAFCIFILWFTSSTAQGGGGSFRIGNL